MKKILLLLTIVIAVFISCDNGNYDGKILLDRSELVFKASGGEETITVESSHDWHISEVYNSGISYLIDKNSGNSGITTIIITVNGRESKSESIAELEIICQNQRIKLYLRQLAIGEIISETSEIIVASEGGEVSVPIQTNINYNVDIPEYASSWIDVIKTKALENKPFSLVFAPNDTNDDRTAIVTLTNAEYDIQKDIKFRQVGGSTYIGDISISSDDDIKLLQGKEVVYGNITVNIKSLSALNNCIREINGNLIINNALFASFDGLYNLTLLNGNLELLNCILENFEGLNNLEQITGDFIISLPQEYETWANPLKNFKGLDVLKRIGGDFRIYASSSTSSSSDVCNLNKLTSFEGLENLTEIGGNFEIEADASGFFQIGVNSGYAKSLVSLTSFTGLENLTTIGGDFLLTADANDGYSLTGLSSFIGLDKLESIGGDFIIKSAYRADDALNNLTTMDGLNSLKNISGNFEYCNPFNYDRLINFSGLSKLENVDGNFSIDVQDALFENMTSIERIGGTLSIMCSNRDVYNGVQESNKVKSLSGLENLRYVGSINISNCSELSDLSYLGNIESLVENISIYDCPQLYDFTPLINIVEKMTGTWYVSECGYNPTKYQMLNGESKPQE